jgi:hypothetical protein
MMIGGGVCVRVCVYNVNVYIYIKFRYLLVVYYIKSNGKGEKIII